MKRVQITIYPQQLDNPHLYQHLIEAEYISDVRTVNWNNQHHRLGSCSGSEATIAV